MGSTGPVRDGVSDGAGDEDRKCGELENGRRPSSDDFLDSMLLLDDCRDKARTRVRDRARGLYPSVPALPVSPNALLPKERVLRP